MEEAAGRSSKRLKINNNNYYYYNTTTTTTHDDEKICRDFFSELPDHILLHILSFMPTEDAIKTTVLIRRFGNLWRSVPVIDLSRCRYNDCDVDDFESSNDFDSKFAHKIHRVSNLRDGDGELDKLSLKFDFHLSYSKNAPNLDIGHPSFYYQQWEKATSGHIDKLVRYAINRKVKVLNLDLGGCDIVGPSPYDLPDEVSTSNYLTYMRLTSCYIISWQKISLKALTVLLLDHVLLSDQIMEKILLGGCPSLQDLSLIRCDGLGKLFCKNPNLKKLMLSLDPSKNLLLSCPHVMSLEIAGWIVGAKLLDASSLTVASISFRCLFEKRERVYDGVGTLLLKISHCKTITLCGNTILMLGMWNLSNVPCPSYRWNNLTVKLYLKEWHHPGLCWLLKSCRSLETLTVYIDHPDDDWASISNHDSFYSFVAKYMTSYDVLASNLISYEFDSEIYQGLEEASFPCLECITIHGYRNEPCVDQMLKSLLKNATKLQKTEISVEEIFDDTGRRKDTSVLHVEC